MEEFLRELSKRIQESKEGLISDLENEDPNKTKFQKASFKKPVMIRQLTARTAEEAKGLDLSTEEGKKNTEEEFVKLQRIEAWLTLSGKPTR